MVKDENFIGKIWKQNCGDYLFVSDKSNKKQGKISLYKVYFLNTKFHIIYAQKSNILAGNISNIYKEIGNIYKQKDGYFKVTGIKKIKNKIYYKGFFLGPFYTKLICRKDLCLSGQVCNPQIKVVNIYSKIWKQNCGDYLKIIKRAEKSNYYFCYSLKYKNTLIFRLDIIIKKQAINPIIEKLEIGCIYKQNSNDFLKILRKTKEKKGDTYLWECEFQKYPCVIKACLNQIKKGEVENPKFPWKGKELLQKYIIKNFKEIKPTISELANSLNLDVSTIGAYLREYNLQNFVNLFSTTSFLEKQIGNYILKYIKNIEYSNWNILENKEIDIYIPSLKLGFEFNGNYWHSEIYKEQNYHQQKSLLAQEKNIKLFHIWEWEWKYKNDIIKSLIKSKLGVFDEKIGASKCKIKQIEQEEYKEFCNENHLQGFCSAKIKIGLFYKNELIQIMSFGVPRFTDKYEWEVIRECSKKDTIILGGKEKLWFYFIKNYNPKSVISYCDFSKFDGDSYLRLGFKKERLNKPGFIWWDSKLNITYLRSPHKHEEMKNKYLKIYDCGQLVFTWFNKN